MLHSRVIIRIRLTGWLVVILQLSDVTQSPVYHTMLNSLAGYYARPQHSTESKTDNILKIEKKYITFVLLLRSWFSTDIKLRNRIAISPMQTFIALMVKLSQHVLGVRFFKTPCIRSAR